MREKLERWLTQIIQFFLFAAIFSPLVFSTRFLFPYSSPGIFFFQICILLAGLSFLLLVASNTKYLPPVNILTVGMTMFFVIQGVLTFFSVEPFRSFIGSLERMNGFWNFLHYYFFFIIAVSIFRHKENFLRHMTMWAVFVATLVSGAYFLLQLDPGIPYARFAFGNSGFIANYIVLHIPLVLWLLLEQKNREKKIALSLLMVVFSVHVFSSGNRSALLGWLTILFCLCAYGAFVNRSLRKIAIIITTLFIISSGSVFLARNTEFVKQTPSLSKFTSWSLKEESIRSRILLWQVGSKGFFDKPLTGWGRENFQWVFEKYYDPEFYGTNQTEPWFDSAHTIILDELIAGGIINLAATTGIALLFCLTLYRQRKREEIPHFAAGGIIVLLSYGIQMLFTIEGQYAYIPLFVILIIIGISSFKYIPHYGGLSFSSDASIIKLRTICAVSLFIAVMASIKFTLAPLLANFYAGQNIYAIPVHPETVPQNHAKIENLLGKNNSYFMDILLAEAFNLQEIVAVNPGDLRITLFEQLLIPKFAEAVSNNPSSFPKLNIYRWVLSSDLARYTKNPQLIKEALDFWEALIAEHPVRPLFLLNAADINSIAGNWKRSIELIKKVLQIIPPSAATYNRYILEFTLGEIYYKHGLYKESIDAFQRAFLNEYLPEAIERYIQYNQFHAFEDANFLASQKEGLPMALTMYLAMIRSHPKNASFHANLSYIYSKMGEKEKAIEEAKKAAELDPSHTADMEKFIQSLR